MEALAEAVLPDREAHHSRSLVDLSENVHVHHRDHRQEFTLDEFLEYAEMIEEARRSLRAYLAKHPEYREQEVFKTIHVAGGDERLFGLIENSPAPNESAYWPHRARIELLHPSMRDEVHVHLRDHRTNMSRWDLRMLATLFAQAVRALDAWEASNDYPMRPERIRTMAEECERVRGKVRRGDWVTELPTKSIGFRVADETRDQDWQKELAERIRHGEALFPILVSTEEDGSHRVIDGEHRLQAYRLAGSETVPCVIAPMTFRESAEFRMIEGRLKRIDDATEGRWNLRGANREWLAYRMARR